MTALVYMGLMKRLKPRSCPDMLTAVDTVTYGIWKAEENDLTVFNVLWLCVPNSTKIPLNICEHTKIDREDN